jgi:hypothetical protein
MMDKLGQLVFNMVCHELDGEDLVNLNVIYPNFTHTNSDSNSL